MNIFKLLDKYNGQMEKVISPLDREKIDDDLANKDTLPGGKMPANVFAVDPQEIQENTLHPEKRKGKWFSGY